MVAPADGRVSRVVNAVPPAELGLGTKPLPRVSIFMSVFDCHVNRSPVAGRIEKMVYRPGKFINADLDKASEDNERNAFVIATPSTRIGVVQIAGLVARRIVPFVREGQAVSRRRAHRHDPLRLAGRRLPARGRTAAGRRRPDRHRRRDRDRRPFGAAAATATTGWTKDFSLIAARSGPAPPSRDYIRPHAITVPTATAAVARRRFRPIPGAHAGAQSDHAAGAVRRPHLDPHRDRGQARMGAGRHRVRRPARRHRRARGAPAQGHLALRRRARQPRRLRQFRRRAGADPVFLGAVRARQCRLDRGADLRHLRRAAARPLQRDDRRSRPAGLGGKFLRRRAGARRRHHRAAADLSVLPRPAAFGSSWSGSPSSTRWRSPC